MADGRSAVEGSLLEGLKVICVVLQEISFSKRKVSAKGSKRMSKFPFGWRDPLAT